ncbi:DEAD/DEAH box helicase [Leucobacter japonicus]|uniref:DEAD/DEAH box helicase n=1 Tax=Leucobacter japonicus TaxID=1461259 RepID=UPI0006A7CE58|nr:DEAD/DEAH box helicase [Leucobacter japonicus]
MAQKKRGGFKPPANYDPNRGRKRSGGTPGRRGASEPQDPLAPRGGREQSAGAARRDSRGGGARAESRAGGAVQGRHSAPRADAGRRNNSRETSRGDASGNTRGGARVYAFDGEGSAKRTPRASSGAAPAAASEAPERLDAQLTTAAEAAALSFSDLGLGGNLIRVLGELGAKSPFPIQAATIPDTIAGRDVLGRARTGSGKTIAFGAAIVERLLRLKAEGAFSTDPAPTKHRAQRGVRAPKGQVRTPKALILAPTRELALQIDRTVQPLARSVGFYTAQMVGGMPIEPQLHALERGVDIVIGTPGRVLDLVQRRRLDLRDVRVSVIDEADHMCDLGFLEPVQQVLRDTVRDGQRLLFSATLDASVSTLVSEFLSNPSVREAEEAAAMPVDHRVFVVSREHQDEVVAELVRRRGRIMVFTRTREYAARLTETLTEAGVRAVELHGNLSQARRERNLEKFATGKAAVLVATDVAARGLHIDDVDLVVQADAPIDFKIYLHRSGRTGRAGKAGQVVVLVPRARRQRLRDLLDEAGISPSFFGDIEPGFAKRF